MKMTAIWEGRNIQGSTVFVAEVVGELEEESLTPDGVGGKGALVEVRISVHFAVGAVYFPACQALLAEPAAVVLVAPWIGRQHSSRYSEHGP